MSLWDDIDPMPLSPTYWNLRVNPYIADLQFAIEDWVEEHALLHLKSRIQHGVTPEDAQRHDDILVFIEKGRDLLVKCKRSTLN